MKASGLNRCDVKSGCVLADFPPGCTLEIFVSDYKSLCQMFTLDIGLKTRSKKKKYRHSINLTEPLQSQRFIFSVLFSL